MENRNMYLEKNRTSSSEKWNFLGIKKSSRLWFGSEDALFHGAISLKLNVNKKPLVNMSQIETEPWDQCICESHWVMNGLSFSSFCQWWVRVCPGRLRDKTDLVVKRASQSRAKTREKYTVVELFSHLLPSFMINNIQCFCTEWKHTFKIL